MNEFFQIVPYLNKKIDVITHNSMDPYNQLIIENQYYINRIFTINKIHRDILLNYKLNIPIKQYINYIDNIGKPIEKNNFTYKIAFVGRLSKEKNLLLLYESFIQASSIIKLELVIIGDGNDKFKKIHPNIKYTGYLSSVEIKNTLLECDYLIIPSYTEGIPFTILEAMSIGIPCIGSDTNGINEIIKSNNGFLFKLDGYSEHKYTINNWNIYNTVDKNYTKNKHYLTNCILNAYNISIEKWNTMSVNCLKTIKLNHLKKNIQNINLNNLNPIYNKINNSEFCDIFINLKDNPNIPFGGGNISTYYIQKYLKLNNYNIHYELNENIDLYLIIDPFKNMRSNKKYGLKEIVEYKKKYTPNSKIVIRVNDCDITRPNIEPEKSREKEIIKYSNEIYYFIFNSTFISEYYSNILPKNIKKTTIFNGCDMALFEPRAIACIPKVFSIVTHHWSSNLHKGYEIYKKLRDYCIINTNFNFIFIGNNVEDIYPDFKNIGPFCGKELVENINKNHIYITASQYDSCPNHVLEAIACGLPILYINIKGGGFDLCNEFKDDKKIGETFSTFEELIDKMNMIRNNYMFYRNNVLKYRSTYNYQSSCYKYISLFKKIIPKKETNTIVQCKYIKNPDFVTICNNNGKRVLDLSHFDSVSMISKKVDNVICDKKCTVSTFGENKINNNLLNILFCSDEPYFVGMFASLHSVLSNCSHVNKLMFNFIIPFENINRFIDLLVQFKTKTKMEFNATLVGLDKNIIHETILASKCYNGGNHLLNIGNFSRLLIGNIFYYETLVYLDSDSIIQCDIYEKIHNNIDTQCIYYGLKANRIGKKREQNICLKLSTIIDTTYDWKSIIGTNINPEDAAFMGAPFITNTRLWGNVYNKIIQIVNNHNNSENGLYNIFTMSLQNIIFYKQQNDIGCVLKCLCDCGSKRKQWDEEDLNADILDWSGNYKPWFKNGLYRDKWLHHDILNLSSSYDSFISMSNSFETFN